MTSKQLKDILRSERPNLNRTFGISRLLSAKEERDEIVVVAEIADPHAAKLGEITKHLEAVLMKRVKVIAKGAVKQKTEQVTRKLNSSENS
jgi:hypothetical protein